MKLKTKYLGLFFILITSSCSGQDIDSLLVEYYNKAKERSTDTVFQRKFFDIFPNNFNLFNSIYGYNEKSKTQRLYEVSHEHITLFCELYDLIPKNEYYRKIINVSLNGHWNADAVNYFQNCIRNLFLEHTKEALEVLITYNNVDIKSYWHFFYATIYYDHPFEIAFHKKMQEKIKDASPSMFELMEEQYKHDYSEYLKRKKSKN